MCQEEILSAYYLQEINNGLIHLRENEQKPLFPYERGKIADITEYADGMFRKEYANIQTIKEANNMFAFLIRNANSNSHEEAMNIMTRVWNYFFSCHYKKWNLITEEWLTANTWLNWIEDYDICYMGGRKRYQSLLDCKMLSVSEYGKRKNEFNMSGAENGLDNFLNRLQETVSNLIVSEEDINKINIRFKFPPSNEKIYLNKMFELFANENMFHIFKNYNLQKNEKAFELIFACILVSLEEMLQKYGLEFKYISHGIELREISREKMAVFKGVPLERDEQRKIMGCCHIKSNDSLCQYVVHDGTLMLVRKEEQEIEKTRLHELVNYISKYMRKYVCYWLGENVDYKAELPKIKEKIGICGIDETILEQIRICIYDITFGMLMFSGYSTARIKKRAKTIRVSEQDKLREETIRYIQEATEKVINAYEKEENQKKIKCSIAFYDKWVGLSMSDCAIIQEVIYNRSCTMQDIADKTGYSIYTIKERFDRMRNHGLLLGKIKGRWQFNDLGSMS